MIHNMLTYYYFKSYYIDLDIRIVFDPSTVLKEKIWKIHTSQDLFKKFKFNHKLEKISTF